MRSETLLRTDWESDDLKVLILGEGYIGTQLSQFLGKITTFDTWSVNSKTIDYHDKAKLNRYLSNTSPNVVINCSGFTGKPNVDEAESKKEECWYLNVTSPIQVNSICNRLGIPYIHISSGCIYDGYEKEFTEIDKPNFGLFNDSSFYSKSKHAFELMSKGLTNKIVRIRMPISPDTHERNYLTKILHYSKLIDYKNSKTYIPDLCNFIQNLILVDEIGFWKGQDIYNVVNSDPLSTKKIVEIMQEHGNINPNWDFVRMSDLDLGAPRSNCVLNGEKANKIYKMRTEEEILREVLSA